MHYDLEKEWASGNYDLFHGTYLGFTHTLEIKNIPIFDEMDDYKGSFEFSDFLILMNDLKTKDCISDILDLVNTSEWNNFYSRILLKKIDWVTIDEFNDFIVSTSKIDKRANAFFIKPKIKPFIKSNIKSIVFDSILFELPKGKRVHLHVSENPYFTDQYGFKIETNLDLKFDFEDEFILDGFLNSEFECFDIILKSHKSYVERKDVVNQMIGYFQNAELPISIMVGLEVNPNEKTKIKNFIEQSSETLVISKYSTDRILVK